VVSDVMILYRDPNEVKRAVSHISWYPDGAHRLAAAYSSLGFQKGSLTVPLESYIWELGESLLINIPLLSHSNHVQRTLISHSMFSSHPLLCCV